MVAPGSADVYLNIVEALPGRLKAGQEFLELSIEVRVLSRQQGIGDL
jgi:hypothetical protein